MRNLSLSPSRLLMTNGVVPGRVFEHVNRINWMKKQDIHRVFVADLRACAQVKPSQQLWGNAAHVIIEGNHRAIAHLLIGQAIPCRLLETDEDLDSAWQETFAAGFGRFAHQDDTLPPVILRSLKHAQKLGEGSPLPVQSYLERLLREKTLPTFDRASAKYYRLRDCFWPQEQKRETKVKDV